MLTITKTGDRISFDYANPYNKHYDDAASAIGFEGVFNVSPKYIRANLTNVKQILEFELSQVTSPVAATIEALLTTLLTYTRSDAGTMEMFTVTAATQSDFTTQITLTDNYKVYVDNSILLTGYSRVGNTVTITPALTTGQIVGIQA